MAQSRYGYRTQVPSVSSRKAQTRQISFKGGVETYKDNDDLDVTELASAIDARMVNVGRYKTRKGMSRFCIPVGETKDVSEESVTGAATANITTTAWLAQPLTIANSGRITMVEVNLKYATAPSGVLLADLYTNVDGAPGVLLATSSVATSSLSTTAGYKPFYFVAAPAVTAADVVWVVLRAQSGTGTFLATTTTNATTALTSATSGTVWTAASYAVNCKLYVTPATPVKGLKRVNRPNGLHYTFFAAGTSMYSVNESTGATTAIKTGLNASATKYRLEFIADCLYWANGYEKPFKYDFSTVTQLAMTNCQIQNPHILMEHVGLLFVAREDDAMICWSNYLQYDTWTSTDFAYMNAPKTPFSITALAKLNGSLFTFAQRNKFQLMGDTNSTFTQFEAASQRGTFSQESLVFDDDTIYYANDDGVFAFNGTDDINLAARFLEDYKAVPNKSSIVLEKFGLRLYMFCNDSTAAGNSQCYVINLELGGKLEALDKLTPVGRASAAKDATNKFILGSNTVAGLYIAETDASDYSNLGAPLQYEIATAFNHFDSPGQLKRISKWRPEFASGSRDYDIEAGYAIDGETTVHWEDVSLDPSAAKWDDGWLWNDGTTYATDASIQATDLAINGEFRRVQRRYRHIAAREPVEFDSEVLEIQTQRLR